jgi:SAM-dependent methyltransferase
MMALAAPRADALRASCPACADADGQPAPSAFPDPLLACPSCGHRWVADPGRHEPPSAFYDELHEKDLINTVAPEERHAMLDARVRAIEEWRPPGRLFDVGCGDGAFLARAEARGWSTTGLETSPEAAARARSVVRGSILCAPLERAALPADLDAVTFWDCLEHLVDPLAALMKVGERLRPGGVVAITMPNAAGAEARLWGPRWVYLDLSRYGHLHHFTALSLRRLVARTFGVTRIDVRTHGSVDLRYVPALAALARRSGGTWTLDRASGLLARAGQPFGLGSTLMLRAQKGRADG